MEIFTLPNGIRLVHQVTGSTVSHCGIFINAGSRDELPNEHGLAHFIEHTIFKGTEKRNLFRVLNRLENIGADLDAFTSKEETCINATFLSEYYERTLELFSDIFFHSVFPEKELVREKQVVEDEIRSYLDNPAEQIFDDFEDMVFSGHPLGRNILGTPKSLAKFSRNDILNFISRNYSLDRVVIASAGNIDFRRLVRLAGKYFSEARGEGDTQTRDAFRTYIPVAREQKKKVYQVHCILGATAYPFSDARRYPLALLNNLLGGPIMNSRLSLALRERNGLTYHNESNYTAYSDSGIIAIYFGTDPQQYEKALDIVYQELKKLMEKRLSASQFHIVKKQLIGQIAIASESNMATMMAMGKSFLLQDKFESLETVIARIETITAQQLLEVANETFERGRMSMLTYRR